MLSTRAAWCLAILLIQGTLSAQQYDLRTWSLEQGSPGATINAICEDPQGHLWIATNEGVARTDGIRFLVTGRREGLPDDDVTAIHCTPGGDVWIGCRNGAIVVMSELRPFILSAGGSGGEVRDIRSDSRGRIWIATSTGGIWIHDGDRLVKDTSPGSPAAINALVIGPDDRAIAGTDPGLHVFDGIRWSTVPLPGTQGPVTSLHVDDQGVLAGTATGYLELDLQLKPLPPNERMAGNFPIALPDNRVSAVLRSKDGAIWIGTPSGLIQISKRGGQPFLRQIGEANGLGHDLVRSLYQDRSGAIWCGTAFGGLSRFMSDAFMHFTDRDGLGSRIVSAIHRTPDGLLYIATAGGGIAVWDGQRISSLGKEHGLDDPYVLTLEEDHEGYLLAGTADAGVMRWDGRRFTGVASLSPTDARVNVISRDHAQRIWVGFSGGLLVNDKDREVRKIEIDGDVLDIEHGPDTTWIATTEGLLYLTDHRCVPAIHPLLPRLPIVSVTRDVQRNIWLGTDGHGLWRINGSRIDSITTDHNSMGGGLLASNSVMSVTLDAFQNVWAGTRRGMHELELDVLQEMVLGIYHYGVEDGFIGLEAFSNAALLDVDSTLWFGTVGGATRYDQRVARALLQEPQVHLTGMRLFFEEVDWSRWSGSVSSEGIPRDLELPFNKNHITFNFTGISPAYPERVHYRYMLEGHDPDWSPITTTSEVIYSNIPPGEYTFKVHARNASGIWTSEPLSYKFSIRAPLWSRTWSQAAALVLLLLIGAAIMRYREQRSRKARERLERMVVDRTRELAGEQQRSESLLLNILPRSTADELKKKGSAHTRSYDNCTVLFSDFTGFTEFSSSMDGHQLVADLDHFFRMFDRITDEFGIEKIKTIGDAYMCASGIPEPKPSHALDAVLTGLRMLRETAASNAKRRAEGTQQWQIRIGIHSGPIVAGVVGEKKFAYDIWGNTVNVASRMESNSAPGRINISGATYAQVMEFVEVQPRGPIKVRGKGELQMYFVLRLKPDFSADEQGLEPNERLLRIRQEMLMLQEL